MEKKMEKKIATMNDVREFPGWQDELNIDDTIQVAVFSDGSVNLESNGDIICEDGFGGSESAEREWIKHWKFSSNEDTTTFPRCVGAYRCTLYCADGVKTCLARRPDDWNGLCPNQI